MKTLTTLLWLASHRAQQEWTYDLAPARAELRQALRSLWWGLTAR